MDSLAATPRAGAAPSQIGKGPAAGGLAERGGISPDAAFRWATLAVSLIVVGLIAAVGIELFQQSALTRHMYGLRMLRGSTWDVVHQAYGALPFIYGTLVTSAVAILIAAPIGIGASLFLSDVAPRWLAAPIGFLIELLAAVPSVIFGLWGFVVLCPWLNEHLYPVLTKRFGSIPLFAPPAFITNFLAAGIILAIMILPFITAVSREVISRVPLNQREAALALGATRWETIRHVVLRAARSGIVGAVILALGRAIGETMAVVMVIGNNTQISSSLLQPGYTMPGLLANQFNEAYTDEVQRSALIEIALILFVITLLVNALARLLILFAGRTGGGSTSTKLGAVRARAAGAVRPVALACLGAAAAYLVLGDLRRGGIRALLGPVELAVMAVGASAAITALARRRSHEWNIWRKLSNVAAHTVIVVCAVSGCFVLGLLLTHVAIQGSHALNVHLFTQLPKPPDDPTGGMLNGITGTLLLVAIAAVLAVPIGVIGGIFLAEFGKTRAGLLVRFCADVLNGIPSVVGGMFAYAAFVLPVGHFSAAAGGGALAIMMIPTIMRTSEEVLLLVPGALREGSLGLGATRVRTVWSVILPAARGGIVTGIMLATARVAGETAPLLFTAFGNDQITAKLSEPVSSLTMMIYRYATSAYNTWIAQAWAGALMLLALVFVFSLLARLATRTRYALR